MSTSRRILACLCAALLAPAGSWAQTPVAPVLSVLPTVLPTATSGAPTMSSATQSVTAVPASQAPLAAPSGAVGVPPAPGGGVTPAAPLLPLPPNPTTSVSPVLFGSQIFTGRFSGLSFTGFDPEYVVTVGDRLLLRMWGAVTYEAFQNVDAQGNVFLPNVGPVHVQGVRNTELNRRIDEQVKRTYKSNVGVYASVDSAQPVKVFVTGFASAPGMYAGLSSDSVINFLDKAGGVDPNRGSYIAVSVMRAGRVRASVNLYDFLTRGHLPSLQFQDGDVISVGPRQSTVTVNGQAMNPYVFEFPRDGHFLLRDLLAWASPLATATNFSLVHTGSPTPRSEYRRLSQAGDLVVQNGDVLTLTADQYPATLLIRVSGAELGDQSFVVPNGSTLGDLRKRLTPAPNANLQGLQLFRKSVQQRQQTSLTTSLRRLESMALTGRSKTLEESQLRTLESQMLLNFIDRAKTVVPLGQVVLGDPEQADKLPLEDGDVINLPARTSTVLVSGEVMFPNAMLYNPKFSVDDYVNLAGGYIQPSPDHTHQLVLRVDGSVAPAGEAPGPGDEVMVLPKLETKNIEVWRALTQVIYQIAVSAKVALGL